MPAGPASPIGEAEFACLMDQVGPFDAGRRVVVGVSGGADSMALAVLLRRWGDPFAVIVDHGLRAGSALEAAGTAERLRGVNVPSSVVTLSDLRPGPDLGARARVARYDALFAACSSLGRPDLMVGHHAQDQAETIAIRAGSGSGPAGLAGMAKVSFRADARIVRPLLTIPPGRLRATLQEAGVAWVDDPTNMDPRTARGALRRGGLCLVAQDAGPARAALEREGAMELARTVTLHPGGYALVHGRLSAAAWSALVWTLSGRAYPPPSAAAARLAAVGAGTMHGVHVCGGIAMREAEFTAAALPALPGTRWDGRFLVRRAPAGAMVGTLDADAVRLRRRPGLPSRVLRALPAIRVGTDLLVVPHLAYPNAETCHSVEIDFRPTRPLAGLPFGTVWRGPFGRGMHMGPGHPMSVVELRAPWAPGVGRHHA